MAVLGAPIPGTDPSEMTPAQAAAAGLGWVPRNHPNYGQPGYVGASTTPAAPGAPPAGAPPGYVPPGTTTPNGGVVVGWRGPGGTPYTPPPPPSQNGVPGTPGATGPGAGTPGGPTPGQVAQPAPGAPPGQLGVTPPGAAPEANTIQNAFRQGLLGLMQKGQQVPTIAGDPGLQAESQAFRNAQQRSFDQSAQALAERNFGEGTLNTGGNRTDLLGLLQDRALAESGFDASLVGRERDRYTDLQKTGLGLGRDVLGQEDQLAFQKYLTEKEIEDRAAGRGTQAELQREGYSLQDLLSQRESDLRSRLANQQADLTGRELGIKEGAIGQEDARFYADLLLRQMLAEQQANSDASIIGMLGGF